MAGEARRKVTRAQLRSVVLRMVKEQGGLCPLCLKPLDITKKGEVIADHDHFTGVIRGALHRSCNSGEGKVTNAVGRWVVGRIDYALVIPALRRLADYLETATSEYIYPTHKNAEDKRAAVAARARARRQAAKVLRQSTLSKNANK